MNNKKQVPPDSEIPLYILMGRPALFVQPDHFDKLQGYEILVANEHCLGFYHTKRYCGFDYDFAVWIMNQKNIRMGIDTTEASYIIAQATVDYPLNDLPI